MTGFLELEGTPLPTVVYVPKGPAPAEGWPTILFLHGRGESGTDGLRCLIHGPGQRAIRERENWPFLMIFPQKAGADEMWYDLRDSLNAILKQVERDYETSPHQRYLTGLSQGGRGTMECADALAWSFAAIAPICGWNTRPDIGPRLRDMPIWLFHGDADTAVPVSGSLEVEAALKAAGAHPRCTIYPGVGHDSWVQAYAEPELPTWFLSHRLG